MCHLWFHFVSVEIRVDTKLWVIHEWQIQSNCNDMLNLSGHCLVYLTVTVHAVATRLVLALNVSMAPGWWHLSFRALFYHTWPYYSSCVELDVKPYYNIPVTRWYRVDEIDVRLRSFLYQFSFTIYSICCTWWRKDDGSEPTIHNAM